MAYKIVEPLVDSANIKPLGIRLDTNNFTPLYLTNDQAYENLKTLLLTRKGERYHQPTFGTTLLNILFEPNVNLLKDRIEKIITNPVSVWLPYITLENIDIVTAEDDPDLNYNIQITISFSVAQYSTKTITLSATEAGVLKVG
jgi:phage baseplate assembly protein W